MMLGDEASELPVYSEFFISGAHVTNNPSSAAQMFAIGAGAGGADTAPVAYFSPTIKKRAKQSPSLIFYRCFV